MDIRVRLRRGNHSMNTNTIPYMCVSVVRVPPFLIPNPIINIVVSLDMTSLSKYEASQELKDFVKIC